MLKLHKQHKKYNFTKKSDLTNILDAHKSSDMIKKNEMNDSEILADLQNDKLKKKKKPAELFTEGGSKASQLVQTNILSWQEKKTINPY